MSDPELVKRRWLASALRDRMRHGAWTIGSAGTSMEPAIPPSSEVEVSALVGPARVGDVLVFVPQEGHYLCGHRVVAVRSGGAALTRGDNTPAADEWVEPARQVGTAVRYQFGGRSYRVGAERVPGVYRRLRARASRKWARLVGP